MCDNERERIEQIIKEADELQLEQMPEVDRIMASITMGDSDLEADSPDDFGYIPDDFEPDLDPYDRQALYEDQMIDDWEIASGENPLDPF